MANIEFATEQTDRLLDALVADDRDRLDRFSGRLSRTRLSFPVMYRTILSPAAQRLGTMWCDDTLSFLQVTVATARIQSMVHELAQLDTIHTPLRGGPYRALLARVHREEHTLGLLIVGACFSLSGWDVSGGTDLQADKGLFQRLRSGHYGFLGLSVGSHSTLGDLSDVVREARKASANPSLRIGIGGPAVAAHPDLIERVGADFAANDAMDAVFKAEALVSATA